MKDLKWQHVVIVVAFMGVLGFLNYTGNDGATLLNSLMMLLNVLGFGFMLTKQSELSETAATIKEQNNGRMSEMLNLVQQQRADQAAANERHSKEMAAMAERLAMMAPMSPPPPAANEKSGALN